MTNVRIGDGVTITGSTSIHEVVNVTSDTQLTVAPVYGGTTGSGKTYSIVPVQGYTKSLADQAKSLLLSFSSVGSSPSVAALAGITGAADTIPYFTSGSTMWTTPLTLQARGLLDDTTPAAMRTTLGLGSAAVANIVGSVGAGNIIETATNGNGTYVRFQDGTQICFRTFFGTTTMYGLGNGIYYGVINGLTWAASFIDGGYAVACSGADSASVGWVSGGVTSVSDYVIYYFSLSGTHTSTGLRFIAIGRWK
jgi:hypothetical protein